MVFIVSSLGFIMILGLFFWYKSFAYDTHSIYSYQAAEITEEADTGNRQITYTIDRLQRYYRVKIVNASPSEITIDIYDSSDAIVTEKSVIAKGEEYEFDSDSYAYQIIISGKDITEDLITVKASTIQYLGTYRKAVVITMAAAIAMIFLWDLFLLAAPGMVKNHGAKINTALTLFFSAACIFSRLAFYRGYYESCFFFIALLSTMFAVLFGKKEHNGQHGKLSASSDEIFLTAAILSLLLSCLLFSLMLNSTESSPFYIFNSRNKMSLADYFITVLLFFFLFFLLCSALAKKPQFMLLVKNYVSENTALAPCGTAVLTSLVMLQEELNITTHPVRFCFCLLLFGSIIFFYRKKVFSHWKHNIPVSLVYLVYFITVGMSAVSATVINYFYMGDSLIMHMDCYYRPFYYMVNNTPIPEHVNSYYGHYPLFYYLPLKLFGANSLTAGVMTGMAGGLTALFSIGVLHQLTKSSFLRIAGSIAVMNILSSGLYLAIVPHRLVFPMMLLFFIVYFKNKNVRRLPLILGSVISVLSIIWNMETGLIVLCVWIVFLILKKASGNDHCLKYVLKTAAALTLITAAAALVSFGGLIYFRSRISNVPLSTILSDMFGVLFNADYMLNDHFNFIRWTNSPWVYVMILFLSAAAYGMYRMGFWGNTTDREQTMPALISIAAMGLGLMVYFISRPENYDIVILPAIFLTVYILDQASAAKWNRLLCAFLLLGLCYISVHTKNTADNLMSRIIDGHQLDYPLLLEDLNAFADNVPEGSAASGHGLADIYMNLGWQFPEDINTAEYLISSATTYNDEIYVLEKEIFFGGKKYFLYRRK